jgi:hypothetical protein
MIQKNKMILDERKFLGAEKKLAGNNSFPGSALEAEIGVSIKPAPIWSRAWSRFPFTTTWFNSVEEVLWLGPDPDGSIAAGL